MWQRSVIFVNLEIVKSLTLHDAFARLRLGDDHVPTSADDHAASSSNSNTLEDFRVDAVYPGPWGLLNYSGYGRMLGEILQRPNQHIIVSRLDLDPRSFLTENLFQEASDDASLMYAHIRSSRDLRTLTLGYARLLIRPFPFRPRTRISQSERFATDGILRAAAESSSITTLVVHIQVPIEALMQVLQRNRSVRELELGLLEDHAIEGLFYPDDRQDPPVTTEDLVDAMVNSTWIETFRLWWNIGPWVALLLERLASDRLPGTFHLDVVVSKRMETPGRLPVLAPSLPITTLTLSGIDITDEVWAWLYSSLQANHSITRLSLLHVQFSPNAELAFVTYIMTTANRGTAQSRLDSLHWTMTPVLLPSVGGANTVADLMLASAVPQITIECCHDSRYMFRVVSDTDAANLQRAWEQCRPEGEMPMLVLYLDKAACTANELGTLLNALFHESVQWGNVDTARVLRALRQSDSVMFASCIGMPNAMFDDAACKLIRAFCERNHSVPRLLAAAFDPLVAFSERVAQQRLVPSLLTLTQRAPHRPAEVPCRHVCRVLDNPNYKGGGRAVPTVLDNTTTGHHDAQAELAALIVPEPVAVEPPLAVEAPVAMDGPVFVQDPVAAAAEARESSGSKNKKWSALGCLFGRERPGSRAAVATSVVEDLVAPHDPAAAVAARCDKSVSEGKKRSALGCIFGSKRPNSQTAVSTSAVEALGDASTASAVAVTAAAAASSRDKNGRPDNQAAMTGNVVKALAAVQAPMEVVTTAAAEAGPNDSNGRSKCSECVVRQNGPADAAATTEQ